MDPDVDLTAWQLALHLKLVQIRLGPPVHCRPSACLAVPPPARSCLLPPLLADGFQQEPFDKVPGGTLKTLDWELFLYSTDGFLIYTRGMNTPTHRIRTLSQVVCPNIVRRLVCIQPPCYSLAASMPNVATLLCRIFFKNRRQTYGRDAQSHRRHS